VPIHVGVVGMERHRQAEVRNNITRWEGIPAD
jgi:hypothetical protein